MLKNDIFTYLWLFLTNSSANLWEIQVRCLIHVSCMLLFLSFPPNHMTNYAWHSVRTLNIWSLHDGNMNRITPWSVLWSVYNIYHTCTWVHIYQIKECDDVILLLFITIVNVIHVYHLSKPFVQLILSVGKDCLCGGIHVWNQLGPSVPNFPSSLELWLMHFYSSSTTISIEVPCSQLQNEA